MIRRINLAAEQLRKIVIGSQRPQQCVTCFRILELFSEYLGPLQVARVEDCRLRIPDGRRIADQASIYIVVSRSDIHTLDRKSVGSGKSVSVRVDLGGRSTIKKKKNRKQEQRK